jgi:hypothetical protein
VSNDEQDRLRRELRAMAAVNRQLQAQLEEPTGARRDRRAATGIAWIEQLAAMGVSDAHLARSPDGSVFVIEGTRKRPVRSGIIAAAIEQSFGAPRDITDAELDQLTEGVPVELFEASSGAPFVVLGGRRCGARGVPLPHSVDNRHASEFPEGDEINVAGANVSRRRFEEAMSGQFQMSRVRGAIQKKGALGTVKALGRRVGSKAKRALS